MTTFGLELEVATVVARQAAAILRADFYRPGGPRGSRHKAVADTEADAFIAGELLAQFPADRYFGEESGLLGSATSGRVWVVDPNDGTASYTQGQRGSTVSIALVVAGMPVLGVVYAFNFPDDDGDEITWCQGGSLRRNGQFVSRDPWPRVPGPELVTLVSYRADRNPVGNAACVAPMRYRALPSIAYRLALAAVGDADAAVSATHPGGYDVAAGHALLLGAGADLYGRNGEPIRYDATGQRLDSGWIIGGSKPLCEHLLKADWAQAVKPLPEQPDEPFPSATLSPATAPVAAARLARAQGCLLGQLAGDSLGSLVEFQTGESIAAAYPEGVRELRDGGVHGEIAGQPTDDSEMALLLARSILTEGGFRAEAVRAAYRFWKTSNPFDCGLTIGSALEGRFNADSQANGALMRVSPLGILGAGCQPEAVAEWAMADAALTHVHPVCGQINALYAMAIADAIANGTGPTALYAGIVDWAAARDVDPAVRACIAAAAEAPPADYQSQMGWVMIAFHNALWQLLHADSVADGVIATVGQGGDADTNGAIAGALLGAVHGRDAVPAQWRRRILDCRALAGYPGVRQPRPKCFWPVDVYALAENLLRLGYAGS